MKAIGSSDAFNHKDDKMSDCKHSVCQTQVECDLREELAKSREWAESQNKSAQGWNKAWEEALEREERCRKALEGLTNAALAGIKLLQSQIDAGFAALREYK